MTSTRIHTAGRGCGVRTRVPEGEIRAAERMGIELVPMGDGFTWTSRDLDETRAKALHGWEVAKGKIAHGGYDLFLLDEFTYVMHFGWLEAGEVVAATGRASGETMSDADSPADVWLVRHPETDWNRDGRYQGRSDRPLRGEPRGERRAQRRSPG